MHRKGEYGGGALTALVGVADSSPRIGLFGGVAPANVAVILALTFGLCTVFLTAPFQSPGEFQHFYRAYQISEGQWVSTYHGGVGGGELPVSLSATVDQFSNLRFRPQQKTSAHQIFNALTIPLNSDDRKFIPFITALYSPLGYLPQAAAIALGRWMGLKPLELMYLGRLSNLMCWTGLVYLAMRIAPCCRRAMLLLMFMPMSLFLAASLSIDAMTNGLSLLVAAIVLRYAVDSDSLDADRQMGWIALIILTLATATITVAKIAYLPMAGLILLVPARRLGGTTKYIAVVLGILAVNALALMAWEPHTHGLDVQVHDFPNVSPHGQIAYLIAHPVAWVTIPLVTILQNSWFILRSFVGRLGWVDTALSPVFLMIYLGVMVAACIPAEGDPALPRRRRALLIVLGCAISAIAAVSLLNYIFWTPVGEKGVTGLQGRYFIPIAPALAILLGSLWGWGLPRRLWLRDPVRQNAGAAAFAVVACIYTVAAVYFRYYGSTGH